LNLRPQVLTRTGDGESFFVQQLLDAQTLSTSLRRYMRWPVLLLNWLELRELSFQKRRT